MHLGAGKLKSSRLSRIAPLTALQGFLLEKPKQSGTTDHRLCMSRWSFFMASDKFLKKA